MAEARLKLLADFLTPERRRGAVLAIQRHATYAPGDSATPAGSELSARRNRGRYLPRQPTIEAILAGS